MPEAHLRRAAEWFLTLKEIPRDPVYDFIPVPDPTPVASEPIDEPDGPVFYDTTLTADEGLWARTGWAGRSQRD